MDLNLTALQQLFKSSNTSYKYLYFYALIKIVKKKNYIKTINYKDIIKEMLIIAWLPSFQFNLKFREQDQIKDFKAAGKVKLRTFLDDIKTTDTKLNGRCNPETVLLKVV